MPDLAARGEHAAECIAELDAELGKRTFAECKELLGSLDAPWAPVQRVDELLDDPQVVANGYIGEVHAEDTPVYRLPTGSVQIDEQPPPLRRAPEHGEHTEAVLQELGYDWDQIAELSAAGVIP